MYAPATALAACVAPGPGTGERHADLIARPREAVRHPGAAQLVPHQDVPELAVPAGAARRTGARSAPPGSRSPVPPLRQQEPQDDLTARHSRPLPELT